MFFRHFLLLLSEAGFGVEWDRFAGNTVGGLSHEYKQVHSNFVCG